MKSGKGDGLKSAPTKERQDDATQSETAQLLPGTLFLLILKSLARGPLHGYAIARQIKSASENGLDVPEGSLYPALNRMVVKGWLQAEWGVSENNRKARFYRLTPEGRKQLRAEAREFEKLVKSIQLVMGTGRGRTA
jgi:transcriptional regulator